jgi:hypothetical protein
MAEKKQELAIRGVPTLETLDELTEILRGNQSANKVQSNSADTQKRIFEEHLNAEDDDALENVGSSIPWQELEGLPVEILGWDWQPTQVKGDGPPIFLVLDVRRLDTADKIVVTNGSWNIIAQVMNLTKRGMIPGAVRILEKGEETKSGGRPQRLVSTPSEKRARTEDKIKENFSS